MKANRFKVGDLVREKDFGNRKTAGYGIVTMSLKVGNMIKYRCLWTDEKEYWIKESYLYLIARGQGGYSS